MGYQKSLAKLVGLMLGVLLLTACTPTPTTGQVRGVIVESNSGEPISGMGLQLLIVEKTATGIKFGFGENNPHIETDSSGAFVFKNVPPGSYGIGSYPEFLLPIMANGPDGVNPVIFVVSAGQVADLGTITIR